MKKVLVSLFALAALSACAPYYDYYRGDVRYTQDGDDCIYYAGETGNHFSSDVRSMAAGKKIVYRNTQCSDLYNRDTANVPARLNRVVVAPAATTVAATPVVTSTCNACSANVVKRHYVFVPAM